MIAKFGINGKCLPHGYIDVGVFMTHRQEYNIDFTTVRNCNLKLTPFGNPF